MAQNNTKNVSVGKPKIGGAVFTAPVGTTLPTSADAELSEDSWANLGYVSDEGLTNSDSPSSSSVKAWGGDVVYVYQEDKVDEFSFKLIETKRLDVLKMVYGSDNVEGTLEEGISVKANSKELDELSIIIDMIINGALKRIVIPNGKLTELGDIVYADEEVTGYEVTITCLQDEHGNTHYEYIKNSSKAND